MTETSPGRRELNRARTHEAIVAALRSLVAELPAELITVEQVAERAGVSRRTFFNYFGSIPVALSAVFAEHAAGMIAGLDAEQIRTDPVTALRRLVQEDGIPPDFLGWLSDLNCHGQGTDGRMLLERTVWAEMAAWLREQLHTLLPDADPLFVSTLSSGVMSCFQAAEEAWTEDPDRPEPLSDADIEAFHRHLDRALGLLASGWRSPHV
ncbi:TetR/AcrR family transcriptional regulator [Serinicoccus kebangsaanensis]|uniref:TetR/AcrR family transcriptional regulator n=1 Tax=Serinicoccus kebangsaanensis TaxID=2602069 RepID=UPI00124C71BB|nr:TetR/AcrR family transcriptional regulator [Serinicoccus kebangsaanensis]